MKKYFFFMGIIIVSSASAQENEFFDINSHLLKKQALEKLQNEKLNIPELPFSSPAITYSYLLPNGDKVVQPPGYNMPCIQPKNWPLTIMPNLKSDNDLAMTFPFIRPAPGQIPNPGKGLLPNTKK